MAIIDYRPTKDTFIADDAPTSNLNGFGLRTGVAIGPAVRRTLMHFDLADFPEYTSIDDADLTVTVNQDGILDVEAYVHRITQTGWIEAQASWNNYATGSAWASPGGDYDLTTPAPVQWFQPATATHLTITGLADFVRDALDHRSRQLHILLKQADEGFTALEYRYLDREAEDLTSSSLPRLRIIYTRPAAADRIIDDPRVTLGAAAPTRSARSATPAAAARPARPG